MRLLATLVALCLVLGVGCGGGKGAGESCEPTGNGAAQCESAICLGVDCSGAIRNVCAGDRCTTDCGSGQVCVATIGGESYCLPDNVCLVPTK